MNKPEHVCVICGGALPEGSTLQRMYCAACKREKKKEWDNRSYKRHYKPVPKKDLFCTNCGCKLPATAGSNTKFCKNCGSDRQKACKRKHNKKRKAEYEKEDIRGLFSDPRRRVYGDQSPSKGYVMWEEYMPPETYPEGRKCPKCGTGLNIYNPGPLCLRCEGKPYGILGRESRDEFTIRQDYA